MTDNNAYDKHSAYNTSDAQSQPKPQADLTPEPPKANINPPSFKDADFKEADVFNDNTAGSQPFESFAANQQHALNDEQARQMSILRQSQLTPQPPLTASEESSLVRYNHLSYLLYAISLFSAGLLWIVPIIMNYARRREADNSWLATHFDWQIKTFWYSLILGYGGLFIALLGFGGLGIGVFADSSGMAIGSIVMAVVGGLMFLFSFIWYVYRIVKGWIALTDNRPVP